MNALILLAHGSRADAANAEIVALAERLRRHGAAPRVSPAYLELAEPTFAVAAADLVAEEVTYIAVLPFFLNSGRHVSRDVPELVGLAREAHPGVRFRILDHIGAADGFFRLLLEHAKTGAG